MKNLTLILIISIGLNLTIKGQNMGEIVVNEQFTATLDFSDNISFIVTGNNPQIGENEYMYYSIFQAGTTCIIRGNDKNAQKTSITVKLNSGEVWYGILSYGEDSKIYYDFKNEKLPEKSEVEIKEEIKENALTQQMQTRLYQLMAERPFYSSIGAMENQMEYQVTNIRNDDKHTYIKMIIRNRSGADYNIDGIFFKYTEGKRRGLRRSEAQIEERIFPVYESPQKIVPAYQTEELGFVIPLFTVGNTGNLEIQIREMAGTRNPAISVSGSEMLKVRIFE